MVERLMVVDNPLAADPENGPSAAVAIQRGSEFLRSYGVTPESAFVGAGVGALLGRGLLHGSVSGFLAGSLVSMGLNYLRSH